MDVSHASLLNRILDSRIKTHISAKALSSNKNKTQDFE